MICDQCQKEITPPEGYGKPGYCGGTGYGTRVMPDGSHARHCYACCTENEKAMMREDGKIYLYLVEGSDENTRRKYFVTNWTGMLRLPVYAVTKGRHNIARTQTRFRFMFEGAEWAGVQYGEHTQVAHCKKLSPRTRKIAV